MNQNIVEILKVTMPAFIEAVGMIIAAIVGVVIAEKRFGKRFTNYDDRSYDINKIMRKAQHDIYIVTICGHHLLRNYYSQFIRYMDKGVKIYYLLLDVRRYIEMDRYVDKNTPGNFDSMRESLEWLIKLKNQYPKMIEIRESKNFLTASYVGIDLENFMENKINGIFDKNIVIHMMPYQYQTRPRYSPIQHIYYSEDKETFEKSTESIFALWDSGETVNVKEYREKIKHLSRE